MKPIFYIDLVWERLILFFLFFFFFLEKRERLILNDKMERLKMARGALKTFTSA